MCTQQNWLIVMSNDQWKGTITIEKSILNSFFFSFSLPLLSWHLYNFSMDISDTKLIVYATEKTHTDWRGIRENKVVPVVLVYCEKRFCTCISIFHYYYVFGMVAIFGTQSNLIADNDLMWRDLESFYNVHSNWRNESGFSESSQKLPPTWENSLKSINGDFILCSTFNSKMN